MLLGATYPFKDYTTVSLYIITNVVMQGEDFLHMK